MRMAQSTKTYYNISVGTLQHALWNVANNVEVCAIIVLKKSAHIMAKLFAYIPSIYHVPNHSLPATSNHKIIPQKSFLTWIWSNLNQFYCAWKLWLFCFIHSICSTQSQCTHTCRYNHVNWWFNYPQVASHVFVAEGMTHLETPVASTSLVSLSAWTTGLS